jgi:hypothetical protein
MKGAIFSRFTIAPLILDLINPTIINVPKQAQSGPLHGHA